MDIRTVLLVDDDADIRTVGEAALSHVGGWTVVTATSGSEAIDCARMQQPDVILLDMMMPGMDGMETLAALQTEATTAGIPVLFVTAKVLPSEIGAYLRAGAQGVIAKPFDPLELPEEIVRSLSANSDL